MSKYCRTRKQLNRALNRALKSSGLWEAPYAGSWDGRTLRVYLNGKLAAWSRRNLLVDEAA